MLVHSVDNDRSASGEHQAISADQFGQVAIELLHYVVSEFVWNRATIASTMPTSIGRKHRRAYNRILSQFLPDCDPNGNPGMTFRKSIVLLVLVFLTSDCPAQQPGPPPQAAAPIVLPVVDINGNVQSLTMVGSDGHIALTVRAHKSEYGISVEGQTNIENPFQLFNKPGVIADLELVDKQVDQIQQAQQRLKTELRNKMQAGFNGKSIDIEELRAAAESTCAELGEILEESLLPHQLERLRAIYFQRKLEQGALNAIGSPGIRTYLDIDDDQLKSLEKRDAEIQAELEREIEKLRERAKQQLICELNPQQRQKVTAMTREKFSGTTLTKTEPGNGVMTR